MEPPLSVDGSCCWACTSMCVLHDDERRRKDASRSIIALIGACIVVKALIVKDNGKWLCFVCCGGLS